MPGRGISGLAVAEIGAGLVLAWSGIENVPVSQTLKSLVTGKLPAPGPGTAPSAGAGGAAGGTFGSTESVLANDMLRYVHVVPYTWGGANPQTGWDCSGAVNYCANLDVGLPIPGYAPSSRPVDVHGPPTLQWMAWAPLHMQSLTAAEVAPGDICLWQTHMGVATSNTQYVSAYDTAEGTVVHAIHGGGPVGEVATFWRYRQAGIPGQGLIPHKGR